MITVVNSRFPEGTVAVITAGTADIPVAEEAARGLEVMGPGLTAFLMWG